MLYSPVYYKYDPSCEFIYSLCEVALAKSGVFLLYVKRHENAPGFVYLFI